MPAEPDNDIESQLRAYAEARRQAAGAPLEMHPATRQMLQAEVARALAQPAAVAAETHSTWGCLWRRLAWAGGLAAVACVALVLTFRGDRDAGMQLADAALSAPQAMPSAAEIGAINLPPPPAVPAADQSFALAFEADPAKQPQDAARLGKRSDPSATANEARMQREALVGPAGKTSPPAQPALAVASSLDSTATPPAELETRRKALEAGQAPAKQELAEASKVRVTAEMESRKLALRTAGPADKAATGQAGAFDGGVPGDALGRGASAGLALNQPAPPASSPLPAAPATSATVATSPAAGPMARRLEAAKETRPDLAYAGPTPGVRFVQVMPAQSYRQNFNSPPVPTVLNSFQFEQLAGEVRIVDADGSVYAGNVVTEGDADAYFARSRQDQAGARGEGQPVTSGLIRQSQAAPAKAAEERPRKLAGEDEVRAPAGRTLAGHQQVFFRVSGTNRSLNQVVVFTGNALVQGVPADGRLPGQTAARRDQALEKAAQGPSTTPVLRIEGRASIGGRSQVPVEAVPQRP